MHSKIFEIATERRYAERGINLIAHFPVIVTRSHSRDPVLSQNRRCRTEDSRWPGLTQKANEDEKAISECKTHVLCLLSARNCSRLLSTSLLCYCLPGTPLWDWRYGQAT
jgi:hypothetical protein